MSIVFNGREDYVRRIFIHFKAHGYADYDYDSKEAQYARKPEAVRKPTYIVISGGAKDKPDIYFELVNARETIYNDLCYNWHLNASGFPRSIDGTQDKLSIETDGVFRIIWMRKEANSTDYVTVAEHVINMSNVEYYWINE